jgi:dTDP-4-amino-4,6-dideoxygalactose transaminase
VNVPFFDLKLQYQSIKTEIDQALSEVVSGGIFIGGEYVERFEKEWAATLGVKHCIGVANGTDSLEILLKAFGIGNGDEVIVPSHTWVSTAEAVVTVGATPVFVDTLDLYYTLDVSKLESKITLKTRAIIPVHMAGMPVDMDPVMALASKYNLKVIEDCAQSHLAKYKNRYTGTIGHAGSFSFYPTKNLGAYGDAGAIVTNDDDLALLCRQLANHGQLKRDVHLRPGRNSKLDSMQAAILLVKLRHLQHWTEQRIQHASLYRKLLDERFQYSITPTDYVHVYHLFIIQLDNREEVKAYLKTSGIDTGIHYPSSVTSTDAFKKFIRLPSDHCLVNESYSKRILSLPIYPELMEEQIRYVCEVLDKIQ